MPVGPGLLWSKNDKKFSKKIMCSQTSFSAMQWLEYMNEYSELLINDDGSRAKLETYHHRGEKEVSRYKVDGYAEVTRNGTTRKLFLEFDGCR